MPRTIIAKYLNPWMFKREQAQQRFEELRQRDGDKCWRCHRPMRFDLPRGHDNAPTVEQILSKSKGGTGALDNLCLCHRHCNRLTASSHPEAKEPKRLQA